MDVIDEVVGSARVGQAFARRIHASGPWGLRFPAFPGVGFHVILRGRGWLVTAAGEPAPLVPGDIIFAPHGTQHGLSHATRPLGELPIAATGPQPPDPAPDIEFLCGACRLDRGHVHLFLRQLPDIVRVSPDYDRHPELLREIKASLAVIARQVGYSSEFAFAGAFRREFGISPGRFRRHD